MYFFNKRENNNLQLPISESLQILDAIVLVLEPGTEYIAIFSGLNNIDAKKAFGMFRTKPAYSTMDTFKVGAFFSKLVTRQHTVI